jgi:hypothetical protein
MYIQHETGREILYVYVELERLALTVLFQL